MDLEWDFLYPAPSKLYNGGTQRYHRLKLLVRAPFDSVMEMFINAEMFSHRHPCTIDQLVALLPHDIFISPEGTTQREEVRAAVNSLVRKRICFKSISPDREGQAPVKGYLLLSKWKEVSKDKIDCDAILRT